MILVRFIFNFFLGYLGYVILNNLIFGLLSWLYGYTFQPKYFCEVCSSGYTSYGVIVLICFFLLKAIVYFLYFKKYDWLKYYILIDISIPMAMLVDMLFNFLLKSKSSNLVMYYCSNRPVHNFSLYLFGNYFLVVLISIIGIICFWFKEKNSKLDRSLYKP